MKTAAPSMPRLYVHDVKGFLWAAAGAILLIDLPLMLGQAHKAPAAMAAATTALSVVAFIWAYFKYGAARQKARITVNIGKPEALELCLAALGQLYDCRITHLNQDIGAINATARIEKMSYDISFQIDNVLDDTWEIAMECRPSDSWALVDLSGRNRQIVYDLRYFLHGIENWDYICNTEIANVPFTARRQSTRKWHVTTGLALAFTFVFLSLPQVGKYAAFRLGMLAYNCGNYTLAKSLMGTACSLDVTAQPARLVRAQSELSAGDREAGMHDLALSINLAADSLAQDLIMQGNILFHSHQFGAASQSYNRAAQTASDWIVKSTAIKKRDAAIMRIRFPGYRAP
jgi:hypothetical protein